MIFRPRRALGCVSAAALLALMMLGCSGALDNPLAPTALDQESADDLAMQSAMALEAAGTEFETMINIPLTAPSPVRPEHADHDTSFTRGNVTFTMSRLFYDAQDQPMLHWDSNAVRMVSTFRVSGDRQGLLDTTRVGRSAAHELRGIQASDDTLRFNGAATDTLRNSFQSLDGQRRRSFYWESAMTAENIVLLKEQPDGYPLSGRITLVVRAERLLSSDRGDLDRTFNTVVVVEFDGTRTPMVTVNGRWRYHWDLDEGRVSRM